MLQTTVMTVDEVIKQVERYNEEDCGVDKKWIEKKLKRGTLVKAEPIKIEETKDNIITLYGIEFSNGYVTTVQCIEYKED